jgi:hypothetical protein
MKTIVRGGYVVGFDGTEHEIIRNGVVVFENDRIVQVGKSYDGPADKTIEDAMIAPTPGNRLLPGERFHTTYGRSAEPADGAMANIISCLAAAFSINQSYPRAHRRARWRQFRRIDLTQGCVYICWFYCSTNGFDKGRLPGRDSGSK